MKTFLLKLLIFFPIIISLNSCFEPVFFIVHEEIPILKPLIDGSPSNFVEYDSKLFVASGKKIYVYNGNKWSEWNKLNDFIISLAATENSLYTLYLDKNNGKIIRYYNKGNSTEKFIRSDIKSICTSANILFVSVKNNETDELYTIYYLDEDDPLSGDFKEITGTTSTSILTGAAYDNDYYYLCTNSKIFCVEKNQIDSSSILDEDKGFTGIINLNDNYAAAITNDGDLYEINNAAIIKKASFDDSRYSTGALALWYNGATPTLLLVGRREYYYSSSTTAYSNGYVEITLDSTGRISGSEFKEPGKSVPSSIIDNNNDRYVSSLGKQPVNHIIQTPASIDPNMTLFASTQQKGVWSYRIRDDVWQWNAEQEQ